MHKNRLEGAAAEGDGKKKLAAPNSRAGLETTSPGFAVKARNNNGAKAASMVVVEEGKTAAVAVGVATRTRTTAGSNGGKAAGLLSSNGSKAGARGLVSCNGSSTKTPLEQARGGGGGDLSLCGESGAGEFADSAGVRGECEKALVALRRGNTTKALRIIRDACNQNKGCALAQRVQGHIYMRLASLIEDHSKKQRHFCAALESAKKASALSPQSLEYAHFYAQSLYEAAKDSKGYEEVILECERALSVDTPVDPAKDSLHYEYQHELPTPEARISHVQQELKGLKQKANLANLTSISSWMHTLSNGTGEDKIRFIQVCKVREQDPMEQRVSQPKRPHEVKKVVKTPEERRQEIEVRVAAARLLQQRAELPSISVSESQEETETEKPLQLRSDRRKSGGSSSRRLVKTSSSEDRVERVRPFWHAADIRKREALLEVLVAELKEHVGSPKNNPSMQALAEAIKFAQEKKTWRFWACCECGERLTEYQSLIHHVMHEHTGPLPQKLQDVLPQELDQNWAVLLLEDDFGPVDGPEAVRMLIENARSDNPSDRTAPSDSLIVVTTDSEPHSNDKSEGIPAESLPEDPSNNIDTECNGDMPAKDMVQSTREMHPYELPVVENEERRKLLEKVYSLCRELIRNKCLANEHVIEIIQFATGKIQSLVPDPTMHYEFDQSPVFIRFLDPLPLRHIHKYLMELAQACGLHSADSTSPQSTTEGRDEEIIQDRLFLNEDFTMLLLDEQVLHEFPEESVPAEMKVEEGETKKLLMNEKGDACSRPQLPLMKSRDGDTHADLQLAWIYGSMEYEYSPSGWKQFREQQAVQGREALKLLKKELHHRQGLCEKKLELMGYEEALNIAENLCVQESRKATDNECQKTYEMVLKQRHQELVEARMSGLSDSHKIELDAISSILRNIQNGQVHWPSSSVGTLTVRLSDSDDEEEGNCLLQESALHADSHVESVILHRRKELSKEVNYIDAKIMKTMNSVQNMEAKVGQFAVLDYRAVVLPLVKSLLKSHLEGEAEKDAMQKSDAAREAFLAELAKDKKSPTTKEAELLKQSRDKPKDKKRLKDQKKPKDVKVSQGQSMRCIFSQTFQKLHQDDCNIGSVTQEDQEEEGNSSSWDWGETKCDELLQQEVELQHQAELEAEERKLAEALELQRRADEESREQHLAEQCHKKLAQDSHVQKRTSEDDGRDVIVMSPQQLQIEMETLEVDDNHSADPSIGLMRSVSRVDPEAHQRVDLVEKVGCLEGVSPESNKLDGNQPTGLAKKSRHRRKRGPRIHAEEGMMGDPEGQAVLDVNASSLGLKFLHGQRGEHESKTLRQLQAEQDDEERFQADLERALQQSLRSLWKQISLESSGSVVAPQAEAAVGSIPRREQPMERTSSGTEDVGKGLQNEIGQYNCFLNVVIQSLWHLKRFREELLAESSKQHIHVGEPCVVCALRGIFVGLSSRAFTTPSHDAPVAPTALRVALSAMYSDSNFFQEAQMNDASEVLAVIFDCLHKAFVPSGASSDGESDGSTAGESWDCQDGHPCIVHNLFGLDVVEQMNCQGCELESRHLKYTAFFHNINASSLRTAKVLYEDCAMDELLKLVDMNHQLACDIDTGGCGRQNYIHHLLRAAPHVFTTVLGWQNGRESFEDISVTVDAIDVAMDIGVVYRGIDEGSRHQLISVVCYYGQHYHCFAYNQELARWVLFDDSTVKVVGDWGDVAMTCRKGHLQPQVLFYEAVSAC
ncbi:unnamed protein product [Sphagnum tenellum]